MNIDLPITPAMLMTTGFERHDVGHTVYVRRTVVDSAGLQTSVHLLPNDDGWWWVEIWNRNRQTGEWDVDGRVLLPRSLQTMREVEALCDLVSPEWES